MRYLIAILIDEDQLVDDEDRPLGSAEAVLKYMVSDLSDDGEPPASFKVVSDGAEEAYASLVGPEATG